MAHSKHLISVCGSELNYLLMALGWTRSLEVLSSPKVYGLINAATHLQCVFQAPVLSRELISQGCRAKEVKSQARVPGALLHASTPSLCLPDAEDAYPLRPLGESPCLIPLSTN